MAKKEIPIEICLWCKKEFLKVRTNKVYCCSSCKIYDHLKKKRDKARLLKQNINNDKN